MSSPIESQEKIPSTTAPGNKGAGAKMTSGPAQREHQGMNVAGKGENLQNIPIDHS
jgi:hypothetical protein